MERYKVLWCDKNIHTASLTDILSGLNFIEVNAFNDFEEAVNEFNSSKNYSLVISGNLFTNNKSGFDFFKALNISGTKTQFLLLTGDLISEDEPCLLLNNFTYASKHEISTFGLESLVEELLNRSIKATDINLKLMILRAHLGLSTAQFASMISSPKTKVEALEKSNDVPSSYIVMICNRFGLHLRDFGSLSLEQFTKKLQGLDSANKAKDNV